MCFHIVHSLFVWWKHIINRFTFIAFIAFISYLWQSSVALQTKVRYFCIVFFFPDAYMCRIDGILLGYRELFVWRKFENNWSAFLSDIQINVGKRKIPIFRGKVDELCLNFSCVFLRSFFKDLWIFKVILLMELSKLKFLKSLKELSDLILYTNCHGIFLYLKDFEFTLK